MDLFTKISMAATIPEHCGLESIGSVADNFARTSDDDDYRYTLGSAEASLIRSMRGEAAYRDYLDEVQTKYDADARALAEQNTRRKARLAAIKKAYNRLRALF